VNLINSSKSVEAIGPHSNIWYIIKDIGIAVKRQQDMKSKLLL